MGIMVYPLIMGNAGFISSTVAWYRRTSYTGRSMWKTASKLTLELPQQWLLGNR